MERALTAVCDYLNNYFEKEIVSGDYTIANNTLECPFLIDGQYFRVTGSLLNDGIYKYPATDMLNESFTGAIWSLAIPDSVIGIADDVAAFVANASNAPTGYTSESFDGYSYTRATDSTGAAADWRTVFRKRLNRWRKVW